LARISLPLRSDGLGGGEDAAIAAGFRGAIATFFFSSCGIDRVVAAIGFDEDRNTCSSRTRTFSLPVTIGTAASFASAFIIGAAA